MPMTDKTTDDLPSGDEFSPEGQAKIDGIIDGVKEDTERRKITARPHLFDEIHAACQRPAQLGHIAQQIGMTPSEAFRAVSAAEENGFIRRGRYGLYEAIP